MFTRVKSGRIVLRHVIPHRVDALSVNHSSSPWKHRCPQTGPQPTSPIRIRPFATTTPHRRDAQDTLQDEPQHPQISSEGLDGVAKPGSAATGLDPSSTATSKAGPQPLSSLLPTHPSHNSLATFISYAQRSGLNPTRHTYLGTRYEYLAQATLTRLGLDLLRIGKTGDRGVDLAGRWYLSPSQNNQTGMAAEHLRVLVQCKRITGKRKLTPSVVREMDGAFLGAPVGWRAENVFGIIVSTKPATKGVTSALQASKRPMVWVCMEELDLEEDEAEQEDADVVSAADVEAHTSDEGVHASADAEDVDADNMEHSYGSVHGRVIQLLYNNAARQSGLEGLDVLKRHNMQEGTDATVGDGIALVYRGRPVREYVASDQ